MHLQNVKIGILYFQQGTIPAQTHSVSTNSALINVLHLLDEREASFEPTRAICDSIYVDL